MGCWNGFELENKGIWGELLRLVIVDTPGLVLYNNISNWLKTV